MLEALGEWMGFPAYFAGYGGTEPRRSGASHAAIAPYGPFECGDGEIVFLGIQNEREWESFCDTVLGQPDLARDTRFENNSERVANREDLHEEIEAIFQGLSSDEAIERLEGAKIANARMRTIQDFLDHPQLEARDRWREVGSPVGPLRALIPNPVEWWLPPRLGRRSLRSPRVESSESRVAKGIFDSRLSIPDSRTPRDARSSTGSRTKPIYRELSASLYRNLDPFKGTVPGACGADLQDALARERREIQRRLEVAPGGAPVVGCHGLADELSAGWGCLRDGPAGSKSTTSRAGPASSSVR